MNLSPFQSYFLSPVQLGRRVIEWFGRHLMPSHTCAPPKQRLWMLNLGECGGFHEAVSARSSLGFHPEHMCSLCCRHETKAVPHPGREGPTLSFYMKSAEQKFEVKMSQDFLSFIALHECLWDRCLCCLES